jgi:hypothetical protein
VLAGVKCGCLIRDFNNTKTFHAKVAGFVAIKIRYKRNSGHLVSFSGLI